MIAYLEGIIIAKDKSSVVLATKNGVGYEVRVSATLFLQLIIGKEAKLFTYFHVREDAQELFGVTSAEELSFFKILVGVSGVGPRSVLNILSLGPITEIQAAIAKGDVSFLTRVSGIGKKIAERMVVELKSKVSKGVDGSDDDEKGGLWGDVVDALSGMGYRASEARNALREIKSEGQNTSELLKAALKILNKK